MESRVTREHHNIDHILTICCDLTFGCRQAHDSCRQVLLKSGFQNHVVAGKLGLSTGDPWLSTGRLHLSIVLWCARSTLIEVEIVCCCTELAVRYYTRHVPKQGSKDQEKQENQVLVDSQKGPCRQLQTGQKAIPQDRTACRQHQCHLSIATDRKLSPELPVLCLSAPVDRSTQCCRQTKKTFRYGKFLSSRTWWFQLPRLSIYGHHYISYLLKVISYR
ncbi:hypothetical protein Taro_024338, partial [Colocasia esculenta]|nr:hypothetical protein [Colocasia esculenta]